MLDCSESQALARCGRVWQCVALYLGMLEDNKRIRFFHERYEHSPLYIRLLLKGIFSRENYSGGIQPSKICLVIMGKNMRS
jgi:hypothetical protein